MKEQIRELLTKALDLNNDGALDVQDVLIIISMLSKLILLKKDQEDEK